MLHEIADEQGIRFEDLAANFLEEITVKRYQSTNNNILNWESLSERQQEVAALACLGYTNAEIAEKLDISLETVKTHMKQILRKFKVRGRHQLRYILSRWDFSDFDFPPPSG
ncbi:MAG: helix-turn-helix transcriptional regulator [Chloroflexi bacterium]|nr:helix-turn-helix transcriptional regulator [Chloroflexota bacterium]